MIAHDAIVRHAHQLQPLPQSCTRLAALVVQDWPDPREVAEVIAHDPVLTAKLLRVANSALYFCSREIGTVPEAVKLLGSRSVFCLAVASCAEPIMEQPVPGYALSAGELWRHSTAAALAAELGKGFCQVSWPPMAVTAALLHDLGKLVLGRFLTPELQMLYQRAVTEGNLEPYQAETEVLSLHHGEVSGVIAQYWKLPSDIVSGVIYHHAPQEGRDTICFTTHLANTVAHHIEGRPARTEAERKALDATRDHLELSRDGFEKLAETVVRRLNETNTRFVPK